MRDEERIKSILAETEYGYIGYGNLHDDDDHGLKLIEKALKRMLPMKPYLNEIYTGKYDEFGMPISSTEKLCPVCHSGLIKFGNCVMCMNSDCLQKIEVQE